MVRTLTNSRFELNQDLQIVVRLLTHPVVEIATNFIVWSSTVAVVRFLACVRSSISESGGNVSERPAFFSHTPQLCDRIW